MNRPLQMQEANVSALPIFPGGCPPSIFGTNELNYRVRDGNGWTLIVINTDYSSNICNITYITSFVKTCWYLQRLLVTRRRIELLFSP